MNQTHKLVFTKKNNTLNFVNQEESQCNNHFSFTSLEYLSNQWHTKNNIEIVIDDITYSFSIYDYLVLSDKFQKASNLIIAEVGNRNMLNTCIGFELSKSEHKQISPFFFQRLLDRIRYDLIKNKNKELNQNFLFLNRLLESMPNRFSKTAESTARDFLHLEKNLDKKVDFIKDYSRLGAYFSHYQNLLHSWDKLIDEDYIKLGYSKEDIDEDGSLSEYKMKKRTSI